MLILDEPTNHLDANTREIIEEALLQYQGTLFIVSHDRYFTEKIIDRVIELTGSPNDQTPAPVKSDTLTDAKNDYLEKKQRKSQERKIKTLQSKLMKEMEDLDKQIKEIDAQLEDPNNASDYEKLSRLCAEREDAVAKLAQAEDAFLSTEFI